MNTNSETPIVIQSWPRLSIHLSAGRQLHFNRIRAAISTPEVKATDAQVFDYMLKVALEALKASRPGGQETR